MFDEFEPDWPARKPPDKEQPRPERRELKLRKKLGWDGWKRYLRDVRNNSQKSLEGPEEIPLEYRSERPTFNYPIYVSPWTKDSYRKRYEAKHERRVEDDED